MNYKYSLICSTVWITFMYGLALPLLFPIAAFTFFNLILMERILITYFHSKPPMYDDKLNNQTIALMKWSPMLLLLFGYWFLGQPQMFDNFAQTRLLTTDVEVTGQTAAPTLGPNLPFFVFSCICFLWLVLQDFAQICLVKLRLQSPHEEPEVDEGLGTYFACVPNYVRKAAYAEECYKRGKLHIKTMNDRNFEKLRTTVGGKKMIETSTTYNLIQDMRYREAFCYDPVQDRDTPEEEMLSDLITQMLYLGYVKEGDMSKVFENTEHALKKARENKKAKHGSRMSSSEYKKGTGTTHHTNVSIVDDPDYN